MRLFPQILALLFCAAAPATAFAQEARFIYRMSVDGRLPEGTYTSVGDYTPDQFSFEDRTDVTPNTEIFSSPVTISGIDSEAGIAIEGGCYLINDEDVSACHAAPGSISNGDTIRIRVTSSPSWESMNFARLSIGGISDTFSVSTGTEPVTVSLAPDAAGAPPDGKVTEDYAF